MNTNINNGRREMSLEIEQGRQKQRETLPVIDWILELLDWNPSAIEMQSPFMSARASPRVAAFSLLSSLENLQSFMERSIFFFPIFFKDMLSMQTLNRLNCAKLVENSPLHEFSTFTCVPRSTAIRKIVVRVKLKRIN